MEEWRLLNLEYPDPRMNMSVEEAILLSVNKGMVPNTVRFWRNANAVVSGYLQDESEIDLEACRKHGVAIVRRITGGGTVYQDLGNLNWTVCVNRDHRLIPRDFYKIFRIFGELIVKAINRLGINAKFKAPNMIVVNNRKVSGMAMCIKRNSILCHGTLLVNTRLDILLKVLNISAEVTTLQRELDEYISMYEIKESITKYFEEVYGINLKEGYLEEDEEVSAEKLYEEKYSKTEWNFGGFSFSKSVRP